MIYYLIKNLKNSKNILNNYYLRNINKLRSEWLENSFKKWAKDKNKDNIFKLLFEKKLLTSSINNKEINN